MKRSRLVQQLLAAGCVLVRHGSCHDLFLNPAAGKRQPAPRHTENDDRLAQHIKKHLGLASAEGPGLLNPGARPEAR